MAPMLPPREISRQQVALRHHEGELSPPPDHHLARGEEIVHHEIIEKAGIVPQGLLENLHVFWPDFGEIITCCPIWYTKAPDFLGGTKPDRSIFSMILSASEARTWMPLIRFITCATSSSFTSPQDMILSCTKFAWRATLAALLRSLPTGVLRLYWRGCDLPLEPRSFCLVPMNL